MRISLNWLARYLDPRPTAEQLAHRATLCGFPVDEMESCPGEDGAADGDTWLEVEVTWNRPDCQCHLGIAREVAGLLDAQLQLPRVSLPPLSGDTIDVAVEAGDICPLYTARVVRGVKVGPSPGWLVNLLAAAGQRSVNNVVDVTNFVLLETGQPLHAFDLAKVAGPRLVARRGRGEAFTSIDGTELELGEGELVIADESGPSALAGVMGGLHSEVGDATTDLVLESALFDAVQIRETARRRRIQSESSFRFERFVDPTGVHAASDRAAQLFVELCGATSVGPIRAAGPGVSDPAVLLDRPEIALRTARIERVLGVAIEEPEIREVLSALGLVECDSSESGITRWRAPSWRPDLQVEVDLIEEVARRVGFDRIPDTVHVPVRPLTKQPERAALRRVRDALVAAGMRECLTAPFVGEGPADIALVTQVDALRVQNPMRAEESLLRRSLLGPLLLVAQGNRDRGTASVRLFECSPIYLRGADGATDELILVAGVLTGDFALGRGVLEALLRETGVAADVTFDKGAPAPLHTDRSATLRLGGEVIGYLGELRPRALAAFKLQATTTVFELRADLLAKKARLEVDYRPPSRFPAVERDLAVVVEESVTWGAIAAIVSGSAGELLCGLEPFDVFRGAKIGEGRKSVAFRMELRAEDRTLTGAEADECVARVVVSLEFKAGGTLRC